MAAEDSLADLLASAGLEPLGEGKGAPTCLALEIPVRVSVPGRPLVLYLCHDCHSS